MERNSTFVVSIFNIQYSSLSRLLASLASSIDSIDLEKKLHCTGLMSTLIPLKKSKESKQKRFLVTTYQLAQGFEDNLIINLAGFETFSRASAYLLTVFPTLNWQYLALSTLTSIFEKHEDSFAHQLSLDSPLVTIGKNHENCLFNLKTQQNYFPFQIRNCQPLDCKNQNCFLEEERSVQE